MERDMGYNISFQVSCSMYLSKSIFYQNPKRNCDVLKSMGHCVVPDSLSYSTCYRFMSMVVMPERPCGTATHRDSVSVVGRGRPPIGPQEQPLV